jgi:DNA-binding MarR family transcriptional regulator
MVRNNEMLDGTNLAYPKIGVLIALKKNGSMSLSAIAQRLSYSKQNLTTLTGHLEAAGMVRRVPDPKDRRVTNLEITPEGLGYLKEGRERMRQSLIDELESLDDADIEALHAAFETVLETYLRNAEARKGALATPFDQKR